MNKNNNYTNPITNNDKALPRTSPSAAWKRQLEGHGGILNCDCLMPGRLLLVFPYLLWEAGLTVQQELQS